MSKRDVRRRTVFAVAGVLVGLALSLGGLLRPGWGHDEAVREGSFNPDVHWSSAYYRELFTVGQAEQLGYVAASPCEPGMGYHYLRPAEAELWFSGQTGGIQILLYDDTGFLVGVEYVYTAPGLEAPPVFGISGPMEGHIPGMPVHYEQHIYFAEPQCAPEGGEG